MQSNDALLNTQGRRLEYRRLQQGFELEQLALMAGMSRVGLSKIEKDEVKSARANTIFTLAKLLKCNAEWLVFGTGPIEKEEGNKPHNTEKAEFFVPLLTNQQILSWPDGKIDSNTTKVVCPLPCSQSTFATNVLDNAMQHWMLPGDTIFVDPQQKALNDNDIILIKLMPSGTACFRKIETIGAERYLVALNESYPPNLRFLALSEAPHIIGTVICLIRSGQFPR